jgi:hypothetical protein
MNNSIHGSIHVACTSWYICSFILWHTWWIYPHILLLSLLLLSIRFSPIDENRKYTNLHMHHKLLQRLNHWRTHLLLAPEHINRWLHQYHFLVHPMSSHQCHVKKAAEMSIWALLKALSRADQPLLPISRIICYISIFK